MNSSSRRVTPPILAALAATAILAGQERVPVPMFERVQPDLFAAGGAFTNAAADYDGDGDLDLFVGFDGAPNRLYRQDKGMFTDVAGAAGVADARPTRAAAWGDEDGDGDVDLLVGFAPQAGASVLRFYRNDGGRFSDATAAAGLSVAAGAVRQPVWVDYDADGDLDLFVAFRDKPNALFANKGGRFDDIAAAVGLADGRRTVGAVWFDLEDDGDLDLVVGNMDGDANGVFRNDDGRFSDVAGALGLAWGGRAAQEKTNGTVRPCAADVNGDGRLDLFFANYGKNGLFLNRGDGKFDDASALWGIDIDARYDTCAFGDMDNDGDLDLYVNGTVTGGTQYRDYLFENTSGAAFKDVTPADVGSPHGDHGALWADFDRDGLIDLALTGAQKDGMHWLLRNRGVGVRVRGMNLRVLEEDGRALSPGSEIRVRGRATLLVDSGSGYNAQSVTPVHLAGLPAFRINVDVPAGGPPPMVVTIKRAGRPDVTRQLPVDHAADRDGVYELRLLR